MSASRKEGHKAGHANGAWPRQGRPSATIAANFSYRSITSYRRSCKGSRTSSRRSPCHKSVNVGHRSIRLKVHPADHARGAWRRQRGHLATNAVNASHRVIMFNSVIPLAGHARGAWHHQDIPLPQFQSRVVKIR